MSKGSKKARRNSRKSHRENARQRPASPNPGSHQTPISDTHQQRSPALDDNDRTLINLDWLAAKYGQRIGTTGEDTEKTVTTALDILHEQGIYAMFLWLKSKDEFAPVGRGLDDLFSSAEMPIPLNGSLWGMDTAMDNVRNSLTLDLRTMFFAKDIIARTLVYARHTAKAD